MSWVIRSATEGDRHALRRFECDSGADCPSCGPTDGNEHQREVQEYLRQTALNAAAHEAPHNDHSLLLLTDPTGGLAGAIAYRRTEFMVHGEEVEALKLVVAGLRVDLHGCEVAGDRLSSHLIAAAIRGLPEPPLRLVTARVAICNVQSRSFVGRHGLVLELTQTDPRYVDLVGRSEDVIDTLPAPLDESLPG